MEKKVNNEFEYPICQQNYFAFTKPIKDCNHDVWLELCDHTPRLFHKIKYNC